MKIIFTLFLAALSYTVSAQNVNIPDATFKALLVADTTINTNQDGEIQVSEATAATVLYLASASAVTNLTGLSAFSNLTTLGLFEPQVTSVNLANHPNLTTLFLSEMPLTTVDISALSNLQTLLLNKINIRSINLTNNPNLTLLAIAENDSLTALDLSPITGLTILDLDRNPALSLSGVNFGNTPSTLQNLKINNSSFTNFYLSTFTQLTNFEAIGSQLTTLDASQNTMLRSIRVRGSASLTTLNIANGNNTNLLGLWADTCANLTCIYVDSAIVGTTPANWLKDSTAAYCYDTTTVVGVSREFSSANEARFYPNPAANYLSIENAQIGSTLWISDALGRVVLRQELNSENTQIATSNLQNGIYFIQFELNGLRTRAEKILISK